MLELKSVGCVISAARVGIEGCLTQWEQRPHRDLDLGKIVVHKHLQEKPSRVEAHSHEGEGETKSCQVFKAGLGFGTQRNREKRQDDARICLYF